MYAIIPALLQWIAWPIAWLLFKLCMSVKFEGLEHLREARKAQKGHGKGIIFALNHVSEFDPILVRAGIGWFVKPMFYVSAPMKEFRDGSYGWRNFFYRSEWFFKSWGSYPFLAGAHDYSVSLVDHAQILNDGYDLTIFPEGGIKRKKPEPGGGVGYLAYATGSVIVPTKITYDFKVNSFADFLMGKSKISICYLGPILASKTDNPQVDSCKMLAKDIMREINSHA
jgi:1-acyl-sn-glycerol-3-phosphate acyltransferase